MKTNAPEKIYIVIDPVWGSMSVNYNRNDTDNIEYIRTDAFIKKAIKYLNEKFYFNDSYYLIENNTFNCMEEMFEDFKNYMNL